MLLDFASAVTSSVLLAMGLVMMKSRAGALPLAQGSGTARAVLSWLEDPLWTGGLAVQALGYVLYIVAVSGAPVSMVAVMMQGGIGLFVFFSVLILGERARPREWAGIAAIVAAIAMLSLSLSGGAAEGTVDVPALTIFSACGIAIIFAPIVVKRLSSNGPTQAAASGIAFGLASLYAKAMTETFIAAPHAAMTFRVAGNPYVYAAIIANSIGIVMLQNSFHELRGMIAMPLSSALSNAVPIVGGMIVFGERLPDAPAARAMRICAFVLTVVAAIMLAASQGAAAPAPTRLKPRKV